MIQTDCSTSAHYVNQQSSLSSLSPPNLSLHHQRHCDRMIIRLPAPVGATVTPLVSNAHDALITTLRLIWKQESESENKWSSRDDLTGDKIIKISHKTLISLAVFAHWAVL